MSKIDIIIDALSVAQNSVWSALNEQALTAARELQAEKQKPEQKPVSTNDHLCVMLRQVHDVLACSSLLPKREWVGLTDEEIIACGWCDLRFARAIEAKLKEKNT
jgi:hypothetical protein